MYCDSHVISCSFVEIVKLLMAVCIFSLFMSQLHAGLLYAATQSRSTFLCPVELVSCWISK